MRRPGLSWKTSALLLSSAWSLASAACSPAEGDDSVNGTESGNPDTSDGSTSGGENVTSSTGETTGVESTTMGTTGTTGSTGDDTGSTGTTGDDTGTTGALAGTPTPLFSTEVFPTTLASTKTVITETLSPDLIKIRVQANFVTADYVDFSPQVCLPSKVKCVESYDLDALVAEFKAKGWSMIPMLSHNTQLADIKGGDIDDYVAFVTWFISRYKDDASIRYVELLNDPNKYWQGTDEELLTLMNQTYDAVKASHPEVNVGTVGLEYWLDAADSEGAQRNEFLLDPANQLKFDFWAFHAYPLAEMPELGVFRLQPPTRTPAHNPWAGNPGILKLRSVFAENGWQERKIIDTEHVFTTPGMVSEQKDLLAAAYMVQDMAVKSGLKVDGEAALFATSGLKITPRGETGELLWGSLEPDGGITARVESVGLFWRKVGEKRHIERVSGEFDDEQSLWVERYASDGGGSELYVYFKPFAYLNGQQIKMDATTAKYTLTLPQLPAKLVKTDLLGGEEPVAVSQQITLEGSNAPSFLEVTYGS